jgi:hypothetical protein
MSCAFGFHPDSHDRVMKWPDNGHMAEVASQPGFRWVRRVRLAKAPTTDGPPT